MDWPKTVPAIIAVVGGILVVDALRQDGIASFLGAIGMKATGANPLQYIAGLGLLVLAAYLFLKG